MEWNRKLVQDELIKRAKKFYFDNELFEKQIAENESYILHFDILRDKILKFSTRTPMKGLDEEDLLQRICQLIYRIYRATDTDLKLFGESSPHSTEVYKAYVFSTLCVFLNSSSRIKGMSINEFIINNDPAEKQSQSQWTDIKNVSYLSSTADQVRKARHRALLKNAVYPKRHQWTAISKDIVHETTFRYCLERADLIVQDTYKRMGNLYNDIDNVCSLPSQPEDDSYKEKLKVAYQKFLSKLHKIKYTNYLELQRIILSHIIRDTEYYGLNLYRFERKLKPYIIINEVNSLLACQTIDEEDVFLMQSVYLSNISFPKLYKSFASVPLQLRDKFDYVELCADEFPRFLHDIVCTSCLILDELVENGTFGDDWENLFRNVINEMAEDVLYDPAKIDFTTKEGSQEKFEKLLAAPIFAMFCGAAETDFYHFSDRELPF